MQVIAMGSMHAKSKLLKLLNEIKFAMSIKRIRSVIKALKYFKKRRIVHNLKIKLNHLITKSEII